MRRTIILGLSMLMLFLATNLWAQTGLGSLKGYISDEQGRMIAGATITLSSDALMGERTIKSSPYGAYRFIILPPGSYTIRVTEENYKQFEQRGISIRAGKTTGLNITLEVGDFEETIIITKDAPLLDLESSGQKYNIDGEFQRSLPLGVRSDYHEIFRMLPGVTIEGGIGASTSTYKVHGADRYYENTMTLDGASMEDFTYGAGFAARFSLEIIQDASIQVSGLDASTPLSQGGHLNIVTKSGGNEFHGTAAFNYQPAKFNDTNLPGGTPRDENFYQMDLSFGGPIIKDKLWFFGAYRDVRISTGISRSPEVISTMKQLFPSWEPFRNESKMYRFFGKVSYQLNKNNSFFFDLQREWGSESYGGGNYTEGATWTDRTTGPLYILNWDTTISDSMYLRSQISYRNKARAHFGLAPGEPAIRIYEYSTRYPTARYGSFVLAYTGNTNSIYENTQPYWEARIDANYFLEDFYGSHELKLGFFTQPNSRLIYLFDYSASPRFEFSQLVDRNDYSKGTIPFARYYYEGDIQEDGSLKTSVYSGYINDTWKPNRRLTINWGVRLDSVKTRDDFGDFDMMSTTVISPRLGLTYSLTADGSNLVRFSVGRLHESVRGGKFPTFGREQFGQRIEYDMDLDGTFDTVYHYAGSVTKELPEGNLIPEDLTLGHTNEFSLGYSVELPWSVTLSADYIYREFRDVQYRMNINPIIKDGKFVGMIDPTRSTIYKYTNNHWNWIRYQDIDIHANKRLSNNLQFIVSYSHDWQSLQGTWAPDEWAGYIQPDAFPNNQQSYNYGSISGGGGGPRGNVWKFNVVWLAPLGIRAAVDYIIQGGVWSGPIVDRLATNDPEVTRFGPSSLIQDGLVVMNPLFNTSRFYYGTRAEGQYQAPALSSFNLRLGKDFTIGQYRLEVAFNIYNLFNSAIDQYPYSYGRYKYYPQYFGTTYSPQPPRAGQLTFRFVW